MFSLYVHVPYCTSICPYCDFNVYATDPRPEDPYVDALLREMRHAAISPLWRGDIVSTVYFGGGTPSLFDPASIRRLIDTARELWDVDLEAEITLEATPESVTAERLALYRAAGVNRLSLGIQSMHARHLERLGRLHGAEESRAAVEAARRAGFDNLTIDLLFAIPGETLAELDADLLDAIALAPEHISAYCLTYEERTPFHALRARGRLVPVDEDGETAMFLRTREVLGAAGYEPYEISSFARPGRQSRHNRGYWDGRSYLGLGAGAHSHVRGRWGRRWSNERLPARYMAAVAERGQARAFEEELSRAQAMQEFVLLGLRQTRGVDAAAFRQRFEEDVMAALPRLVDFTAEGLLEATPAGFRLTAAGLLLADSIAATLV